MLTPKHAPQLHGADTLLGLADDVCSREPLDKGKVGVVEDRPARHRKLVVAEFAVEQFGGFLKPYGRLAASQAFRAARPTQSLQKLRQVSSEENVVQRSMIVIGEPPMDEISRKRS